MKKIVVLVDENYEDLELWYPRIRLQEAGFNVIVAGAIAGNTYRAKHGYPCKADVSFDSLKSDDLMGVVIPGGFAPDKLRRYPVVLELVRKLHAKKKCIAFICHAGWVPISAKILKGKKVTGTSAIKDDLENAGATFVDKAVVTDGNLISSRTPDDLPFFAKEIIAYLQKMKGSKVKVK